MKLNYLEYTALIGSVVIFFVFRLTWLLFTLEQNMIFLMKSPGIVEPGLVFQEAVPVKMVRTVPGDGLTDQNLTMKIGNQESLTTVQLFGSATHLKTVLKLESLGLGVGIVTLVDL